MESIAAVLIVKNEEALLGRCLESVKEADEIVVCDTGSEDSTLDVARKYTDKVFEVPREVCWMENPSGLPIFHFANARNYAKSKASADWILSIDADEFLHDFSKVREAVTQIDRAGNVLMVAEDGTTHFVFTRLFRNLPDIQWEAAAHNHITAAGEKLLDVIITYGYSPTHQKDPDRTLRILEWVVQQPGRHTRELFYLGREYWYKERFNDCVQTLVRYIQESTFDAERAEAFIIMAHCFYLGNDYPTAKECCMQALLINATWREPALLMAKLSGYGSGDQEKERQANQWFRMAEQADNYGVLFVRNCSTL